MATILSSRTLSRRRSSGFSRLARWLDEVAPVILLVAVVAILAAAGHEAGSRAVPELAVAPSLAE